VRPLPALAVVCALTALAFLVSGCGGGGGSSSAEAWASDVCSAIGKWRTDVQQITTNAANTLTEPGATRKDAEQAIGAGIDATQNLLEELKALGPPDADGRDEARSEVNAFVDQAQSTVDDVKRALADLPEEATLGQLVAGLSGLSVSLQKTIASGQQLVKVLAEASGDLKQGFENARSCKELSG
jgi:hypothetical protein